jgi:tetratricopeptide (TPR) repeat protein
VGDKAGEASTLNNVGLVYFDLGEKQQALNFYNQSLPLSRQVGDKAGEANTLYNIAYVERNRGNLQAALAQIQAAINISKTYALKLIAKTCEHLTLLQSRTFTNSTSTC